MIFASHHKLRICERSWVQFPQRPLFFFGKICWRDVTYSFYLPPLLGVIECIQVIYIGFKVIIEHPRQTPSTSISSCTTSTACYF
ncbi:hypothetical protein BKA66DRAFT_131053 [Pyrenochaeta sp. MPI-SDFR-AT-0127]|nr:hypothetical protein BKA66DRAFT_131053 [Pyrenochaeta sp. MPI-SDFR-AT-0127]